MNKGTNFYFNSYDVPYFEDTYLKEGKVSPFLIKNFLLSQFSKSTRSIQYRPKV